MTLRAFTLLLFALSPLLCEAQPTAVTANAPIINFKLPELNDDGNRISLLRGNEARRINDNQIDLVAMQYIIFKPDGSNQAETSLLAPTASVFFNQKRYKVQGAEGVRIVRDDLDVAGVQWTFETDEKKNRHVVIENNVKVVFRTLNIGNILK
ncbi:MAG: hypothetical protein QM715_14170 [Nibricoccus sp.]